MPRPKFGDAKHVDPRAAGRKGAKASPWARTAFCKTDRAYQAHKEYVQRGAKK